MKIHDIKIDTTIMGDEIRHTIKDEITQHMSATTIRTQDEHTIEALKKLGWLSPSEAMEVVRIVKILHAEIGRDTNRGNELIQLIEDRQT